MVEQFLNSFQQPPQEITLDFDATDDRVHGQQENRFFHGYYPRQELFRRVAASLIGTV